MNSETNNLLANRYMGRATYEDLVDWAIGCLERNLDSKNIRILASMRTSLYPSEVEYYFSRSLQDLGWTMPDRRECLFNYARYIAQQIISGDLPPQDGCLRVHRLAYELDHPDEFRPWCHLNGGFDPTSYNELQEAELDEEIRNEAARFLTNESTL